LITEVTKGERGIIKVGQKSFPPQLGSCARSDLNEKEKKGTEQYPALGRGRRISRYRKKKKNRSTEKNNVKKEDVVVPSDVHKLRLVHAPPYKDPGGAPWRKKRKHCPYRK